MAGEKNYVRLPPDSTGKRIQSKYNVQILFKQLSPTSYQWSVDQNYQLASGAVFRLNKVHSTGATTGILFATLSDSDIQDNVVPVSDENILESDGITVVAKVDSYVDTYIQNLQIRGTDNPEYGLNIDQFGSAQIRFQEGPAELSPFGKLLTTAGNVLANFDFSRSPRSDEFNSITKLGSTNTWDPAFGHVKLAIDGAGQLATHASQIWFPLEVGTGNLIVMATRLGDAGSSGDGTTRNWGSFGPDDGFFFSLVEDTLYVVHRRTFNGVKTDGTFPQSNWNVDKLDGTGASGFTLDLTKNNAYFIDYQWIGGGVIRWGVINNGIRVTCHKMNMNNKMTTNATLPSGLPICWAAVASGSPVSTKEIFAYGAGIFGEQPTSFFEEAPVRNYFGSGYSITGSSTSTQYQFTLSPELTYRYAPSIENHTLYEPRKLLVDARNNNDGSSALVEVRVFQKCLMRDLHYEDISYTSVQVDTVGDHLAHGPEMARFTVDGESEFEFFDLISGIQNGVVSNANEQSISRRSQSLSLITGTFDKYGTGIDRVKVTVGNHPIYGTDVSPIHFFDDKGQVVFRGTDGSTTLSGFAGATNLSTSESNWYYLSLIDRDEAWLYLSSSQIDDDRAVRVMTVDNVTSVTASEVITLGTGETAFVKAIDAGNLYISVEGRSSSSFDNGYTGTWSTTSGGSGNVTQIDGYDERVAADPTWTIQDEREAWGADFKTTLQAVDSSGWANPSDSSTTNVLFGIPPARAAWTFMVRHMYTKATDTDLRWRMFWKELKQ